MPIKYEKLIKKMKEAGITSYTIKRDKIIGQATYKKIMEGGDIDTRTIAKLCKLLNCQPGDIMEYVKSLGLDIPYMNIPMREYGLVKGGAILKEALDVLDHYQE